jgi:hypothetical protein
MCYFTTSCNQSVTCVSIPRAVTRESILGSSQSTSKYNFPSLPKIDKPWEKCPDSSWGSLWHSLHPRTNPDNVFYWLYSTLRPVSHAFPTGGLCETKILPISCCVCCRLSRTGEHVRNPLATAFPPTNKVKLNLVLEITKSTWNKPYQCNK